MVDNNQRVKNSQFDPVHYLLEHRPYKIDAIMLKYLFYDTSYMTSSSLIKLLLSVQVITHSVIWITLKIPLLLVGNGLCSKTQPPYSPADVVTWAQGLISSLTV